MSKSFLKLVAIALVAFGFVACDDKQLVETENANTELLKVASSGDLLGVKYQVLKQGANVNAKDKDGSTALMLTTYLEIAKFLIEKGADINARDKDGWTALLYDANRGYSLEKIKYLVEKGADINAKSKSGRTALMLIAKKRQ